MDLKEEGLIAGDIGEHWYYKSKARAIEKYIEGKVPKVVLDVGAGSGFFSKYLMARLPVEQTICVDIGYEEESSILFNGKEILYRKSLQNTNADLVLLMDVLEHIEDDVSFLKEVAESVPQGAELLITVPAFQMLWSGHDEFLEHKRRYTLSSLRDLVCVSGLELIKENYFYGSVFPLAAVVRLLGKLRKNRGEGSDMKGHSNTVNAILTGVCSAELSILNVNKLMGLSAFCLCRKL